MMGCSKVFEVKLADKFGILAAARCLFHTLGVDSIHKEQVQLVLASVLFQPLLAKTVGEMQSKISATVREEGFRMTVEAFRQRELSMNLNFQAAQMLHN